MLKWGDINGTKKTTLLQFDSGNVDNANKISETCKVLQHAGGFAMCSLASFKTIDCAHSFNSIGRIIHSVQVFQLRQWNL